MFILPFLLVGFTALALAAFIASIFHPNAQYPNYGYSRYVILQNN